MEGCPLVHMKFQGNCVNCPQVTDCVFLNIMKNLAGMRTQLRGIDKRLQVMQDAGN
jgi:hypothetical protein